MRPALALAMAFFATPVRSPNQTTASFIRGVAMDTVAIRGVVRDLATGQPIEGAVVRVAGSTLAASADPKGSYAIRAVVPDTASAVELSASRVGYASTLKRVSLGRPRLASVVVDIQMSQAAVSLEAITASATVDPVSGVKLPFTMTRLDASQMPTPAMTGAAASIQGKVAGVTVGGGNSTSVVLRAVNSPMRSADPDRASNTEEYGRIEDNPFLSVRDNPLSTFGVDVDRASYGNVRRFVRDGALPPKDAVRIEELINYFPYRYAEPTGEHPIAISTEVAPAPWNANHRILRIGLQTSRIATDRLPASNLVFLLDVSGSMDDPRKLPLVKRAFGLLVNELREQDRVAIVVYAGAAGVVLQSTSGANKHAIMEAIERLSAGGSTAGGEGIRLAYDIAARHLIRGGNNRVILATDGDFNVGISSTSELVRFVEERRNDGIALTVLGFGMGNLKDGRLEQLADKGNGNYAYVDDLQEARKVLVHEMGATLVTVAKDVKLQVEFNPRAVQAYRLIGYENRLLAARDFNDDTKDAGEMGAGHSVTALYEVVPANVELDVNTGTVSPLRYQSEPRDRNRSRDTELGFVNVRYKPPTASQSILMQRAIGEREGAASADMRFAMAVAGYGMLLRSSEHRGDITFDRVLTLARGAAERGDDGYRVDFVRLVESTKAIARSRAGERH